MVLRMEATVDDSYRVLHTALASSLYQIALRSQCRLSQRGTLQYVRSPSTVVNILQHGVLL